MKKTVPPTAAHLRVIRNLTTSTFYALTKTHGIINLLDDVDVERKTGEYFYKIRTRLDSYKTFLQAIPGSEDSPAALALLGSVMTQIDLLKKLLLSESVKLEISKNELKIEPLLCVFHEGSAAETLIVKSKIPRAAAKLNHELSKIVSTRTNFYLCVCAAKNYFSGLRLTPENGMESIIREISFPPEYQQAGVAVLSYFSEVLKDRYPEMQVSVTIQQQNDVVTMVVTLPDGSKEEVSKILNQYGMVITGKMSPRDIVSNDIKALALQQKLELANLEIRQTRELLNLQKQFANERISSLESDVKHLRDLLGQELDSRNDLQNKLLDITKQMLDGYANGQTEILVQSLAKAITLKDKDRTKTALEDIKSAEPDLFEKIHAFALASATSGLIGNAASDWLKAIILTFPK